MQQERKRERKRGEKERWRRRGGGEKRREKKRGKTTTFTVDVSNTFDFLHVKLPEPRNVLYFSEVPLFVT
eukprot:9142594-Ditylum_brightwellii.AAC.1